MTSQNKLSSLVGKIDKAPKFCRSWLISTVLGRTVKFAGTAGIVIEHLNSQSAKLSLTNKKSVQNHIGGVHAAAMALLAESATGFLVGMHVKDDCIPLLKSMHIEYLKRATGHLTATAQLKPEQISLIQQQEKGEISVEVRLIDQIGIEPIKAEFIWAWVPKKRNKSE